MQQLASFCNGPFIQVIVELSVLLRAEMFLSLFFEKPPATASFSSLYLATLIMQNLSCTLHLVQVGCGWTLHRRISGAVWGRAHQMWPPGSFPSAERCASIPSAHPTGQPWAGRERSSNIGVCHLQFLRISYYHAA